MSKELQLDLASWECADLDAQFRVCRDVEGDDEWICGVGGVWIPFLVGRRRDQNRDFNLCVAREQLYERLFLFGNDKPLVPQWKEAWEQERVGHLFCLDENLELAASGDVAWKVFLSARGVGSWQRESSFPGQENSGDIVQHEPQSFRWHSESANRWLGRPACDWFAAFKTLARDQDSDVEFAARWAAKERDERFALCAATKRDSFALFERALRLGILSDDELWQNAGTLGFQFQLLDDEVTGKRAWFRSEHTNSVPFSPRFDRLWNILLAHFEPERGGPLASYSCVKQWLSDTKLSVFDFWTSAPTQHEKMEALLELRALLQERGLDAQNELD